MNHANLTRHLVDYQRTSDKSDRYSDDFFATAGEGNLVVESSVGGMPVIIQINGKEVETGPVGIAATNVALTLVAGHANTIDLTLGGERAGSLRVRITQDAQLDFQFTGYTTYAGNTLDFQRSVDFYAQLGWTTKIGGFPKTNSHAMGEALGVDGPYTIDDGALLILTYGNQPSWIDLLEWEYPRIEEPPYAGINHLGMAHAAYVTTDIDSDYDHLKSVGVEFLTAPVGTAGERFGRFVFLKDPDGIFIQLLEVPDELPARPCDPAEDPACPVTHLTRPHHISVNVRDFVGAREYFRLLGYTESDPLPSQSTTEEGEAMGFDQAIEIIGADLRVPADVLNGQAGVDIRLQQWLSPFDDAASYPLPIMHVGIQRLVLNSDAGDNSLATKVAMMESQGLRLVSTGAKVSEESPGGLFLWEGPEGIFLETGGSMP